MDELTFLRPDGLLRSPAFSWVAVVPPGATTIHVGGINATTADGTIVGDGDIGAQTTQVMDNLRIALEAAEASLRDLVSLQLFLVDGIDLTAGYQAAAAALPQDREPPLITVGIVSKLGVPAALLELSAIAAVVR
jgi:enamine deaminase RidA (YjgF/YER057c/UK114 family)